MSFDRYVRERQYAQEERDAAERERVLKDICRLMRHHAISIEELEAIDPSLRSDAANVQPEGEAMKTIWGTYDPLFSTS